LGLKCGSSQDGPASIIGVVGAESAFEAVGDLFAIGGYSAEVTDDSRNEVSAAVSTDQDTIGAGAVPGWVSEVEIGGISGPCDALREEPPGDEFLAPMLGDLGSFRPYRRVMTYSQPPTRHT